MRSFVQVDIDMGSLLFSFYLKGVALLRVSPKSLKERRRGGVKDLLNLTGFQSYYKFGREK